MAEELEGGGGVAGARRQDVGLDVAAGAEGLGLVGGGGVGVELRGWGLEESRRQTDLWPRLEQERDRWRDTGNPSLPDPPHLASGALDHDAVHAAAGPRPLGVQLQQLLDHVQIQGVEGGGPAHGAWWLGWRMR
jgi:hypothetical protein